MKHLGRKLLLPVAAVALAGGSFAFLASNNVATSYAGSGSGTIAGYNVHNIHYTTVQGSYLHDSGSDTVAYITGVSFSLDNPASAANVIAVVNRNVTGSNNNFSFRDCVSADSYNFSCTIKGNTYEPPSGGAPVTDEPFADYFPQADSGTNTLTILAAS